MALNYALYMRTDVSSADLLATCKQGLADLSAVDPALTVHEQQVDAVRNETLKEGYGLTASSALSFRIDSYGMTNALVDGVLGASLRVIDRHAGDALLLFNGDVAYFIRRRGRLTVNARDGMWGPERVALIVGEFACEEIPDL